MSTATPRASGGSRRVGQSRADFARRWNPANLQGWRNPWTALWAMMIGFFMIMVDSTIVAVANPTIMADLHVGYAAVVWVTSAYLLGYAVVLLVAGRLGDRYGTKNLYLIGLVVFTAASMGCGLSGSAAMLIAARVVQGVGAGVLTPQTLSTITQIFPPQRRGAAVSVWGATAGVATLVGPLAGGVLVDGLGWQWIFFINVPIGIVGLGLAAWLVPVLPTHVHRFDLIGVVLSGAGVFLVVFGLQQGQAAHWQPWVWAMIVGGVGFLSVFVYWQAMNTHEPLIPLQIFGDRDFSLCNVGVAITAFASTAMMLPLTFYAQAVCGLSPTRTALLIAPMAIANGVLAPLVGVIVDRYHPRPVLGFGFSMLSIGLTWLAFEMRPDTAIWRLVLPFFVVGMGSAFVWSPLTATATRNLPPHLAGAGSAVYNSVRQFGAVLGSAGMAAFMTSRIGAEMPRHAPAAEDATGLQLPEYVREPFSFAMSQSVLLPAFIALFGIIAALFLLGFIPIDMAPGPRSSRRVRLKRDAADSDDFPDFDDDDYVEFVLRREPGSAPPVRIKPAVREVPAVHEVEEDTEPLRARVPHPQPPPPQTWRTDSRHGVLAEPVAPPRAQPIGFAHNGSHVDNEQRLRPVAEHPWRAFELPARDVRPARPPQPGRSGPARQHGAGEQPSRQRPDDATGYGRHASGR